MGTLASAKELKVAAATGAAAASAAAAAAASGLGQQNGVDMYGFDGVRDDLPGVCPKSFLFVVHSRANELFSRIDTMAPDAPLNSARL